MKVLVLLSLVALCFSTQLTVGKRITVWQDGTITIMGTNGREIDIYKNIIDPRKIDMILRSPLTVTRKIEVDTDINTMESMRYLQNSIYRDFYMDQTTQADILSHLFRQYEGMVDETTYQTILKRIHHLVQFGFVHQTVLNVLMDLETMDMVNELKMEHYMMKTGINMDHMLSNQMTMLPMETGMRRMHDVSEVMPMERKPEYMTTLLNLQNGLKYNTNELRNLEDLTPIQRSQMLIEKRQTPEMMEKETLTGKNLYRNQFEQMTPLTHLMYNMKMMRGQDNLWAQEGTKQMTHEMPLENMQERMGKMFYKKMMPQQMTRPLMQTPKMTGMERFMQQGQMFTQEPNMMQRYYQRMM